MYCGTELWDGVLEAAHDIVEPELVAVGARHLALFDEVEDLVVVCAPNDLVLLELSEGQEAIIRGQDDSTRDPRRERGITVILSSSS